MGVILVGFVEPAIHTMPAQNRQRFYWALYTRTRIGTAFPIASGLTTAAGLLLYLVSQSHLYFSQNGNIVLGTGALFGLLAFGHGAAATGPLTGRYTAALAAAYGTEGGAGGEISADQLASLEEITRKHDVHTRISVILGLIALVAMASARYL
jgi:hypothetical protein